MKIRWSVRPSPSWWEQPGRSSLTKCSEFRVRVSQMKVQIWVFGLRVRRGNNVNVYAPVNPRCCYILVDPAFLQRLHSETVRRTKNWIFLSLNDIVLLNFLFKTEDNFPRTVLWLQSNCNVFVLIKSYEALFGTMNIISCICFDILQAPFQGAGVAECYVAAPNPIAWCTSTVELMLIPL